MFLFNWIRFGWWILWVMDCIMGYGFVCLMCWMMLIEKFLLLKLICFCLVGGWCVCLSSLKWSGGCWIFWELIRVLSFRERCLWIGVDIMVFCWIILSWVSWIRMCILSGLIVIIDKRCWIFGCFRIWMGFGKLVGFGCWNIVKNVIMIVWVGLCLLRFYIKFKILFLWCLFDGEVYDGSFIWISLFLWNVR